MLNNLICKFFSHYYGRALDKLEVSAIIDSIEDLDIDVRGNWMTNLFKDLMGARLNQNIEIVRESANDMNSDSGFTNLIFTLQQDHGFEVGNYHDCGEAIEWTLGATNLELFLCREGLPDFYIVTAIKEANIN